MRSTPGVPWRPIRISPVQEPEAVAGAPVTLHGTVWGRTCAGTAIIQLPSGALVAVPLEDVEPATAVS